MKSPKLYRPRHWLILAGICAVQLVAMCYIATLLSATPDEYPHLAAGLNYLETGRFDLYNVNPPPIKIMAALPAWYLGARCPDIDWRLGRPEFVTGLQFAREYGLDAEWFLVAGRWICCSITVAGTLIVYSATKSILNCRAAYIAAVLWASCPLILAYGALLSFDVASAVFGLASAWRVEKWISRQSLANLLWASASIAGAILVKFTWLIWVVLFPAIGIWLCIKYSLQQSSARRILALRVVYQVVLWAIVALFLLNLAYLCQGTGLPIKHVVFQSAKLSKLQSFVAETPFVWPVPQPMVSGLDTQLSAIEIVWPAVRFGKEHQGGVWYFYVLGLALKCSLGALLLALLSVYDGCRQAVKRNGKWWIRQKTLRSGVYFFAALLPTVLVSSESNMNDHFRYCFFLLGFLSLAAGGGAWLLISRRAMMTLSLCLLSCLLPLLSFPYLHNHVNILGKSLFTGVDIFGGSVADWQQGWWAARKWSQTQLDCEIWMFCSQFSDPYVHHLTGSFHERPAVQSTSIYFLISTSDRIRDEVQLKGPLLFKLGGGVEVYQLHALPPFDPTSLFKLERNG